MCSCTEMPNTTIASQPLANPTAYQLRSLVLDYLCHSCYTGTASAFNRDSTVRQLDADGDEILEDVAVGERSEKQYSEESFQAVLEQVQLRQAIRTYIMSGRVDDAITLLNIHFPSVLSEGGATEAPDGARPATSNVEYVSSTSTEPAHLYLNLRILAFSEACRTVPLPYPSSRTRSSKSDSIPPAPSEGTSRPTEGPQYIEQQMDLLTRAQKLYAYLNTLPNMTDRAIYMKELENVGGLLAYKVPEESSVAKYLAMERREAVADQINRAILKRTNQPLVSSLELVTRQTQLVWQLAHENGIKVRPGAVMPPRGSGKASPEGTDYSVVPTFDLNQFLDAKS